MGFVVEKEKKEPESYQHIRLQPISHPFQWQPNLGFRRQNCWLCEGWLETKFAITEDCTKAWLHLSIDNFEPIALRKNGKEFHLWRMLPPIDTVYFFFSYE